MVAEYTLQTYTPWCCTRHSTFDQADFETAGGTNATAELQGRYVTMARGDAPSVELPTSTYLIAHDMKTEIDPYRSYPAPDPDIAGVVSPYVYITYSTFPADYPVGEPGPTYFSIGGNDGIDVADYDALTNEDKYPAPVIMRVYESGCASPSLPPNPSPPPPTPSPPPPSPYPPASPLPFSPPPPPPSPPQSPPASPPVYVMAVGWRVFVRVFIPAVGVMLLCFLCVGWRLSWDRTRTGVAPQALPYPETVGTPLVDSKESGFKFTL